MSGSHVWAERYDRDLDDIFELQDEISATIIAAIEPELSKAEQTRALRQTPDSLDAWSFFQRGMWHHFRSTQEDNALARVEIQKAIELDPNFSRALAVLAHVYYWDVLFGFAKEPDAAVKRGMNLARRAIVADDHEPFAHFALGRISTLLGDFDMAREELNIAVDLNPNFAHAHYALGHVFNLSGKPSKAVEAIDRAIRLNPNDPAIWTFLSGRAWSHQLLGQHDEAHVWALKGARQVRAGWLSFAILASTSAELGLVDETRQAVKETLNINPDFKVSSFMNTFPNRAGTFQKIISASLANAGLPE
jgi:adenylate cyclase